jgi:hypothetical protein
VRCRVARIKGELLLLQGGSGAAVAAEDHFRQALDWARRQGALSWELRGATSLARLRRDQYRSTEAISMGGRRARRSQRPDSHTDRRMAACPWFAGHFAPVGVTTGGSIGSSPINSGSY